MEPELEPGTLPYGLGTLGRVGCDPDYHRGCGLGGLALLKAAASGGRFASASLTARDGTPRLACYLVWGENNVGSNPAARTICCRSPSPARHVSGTIHASLPVA